MRSSSEEFRAELPFAAAPARQLDLQQLRGLPGECLTRFAPLFSQMPVALGAHRQMGRVVFVGKSFKKLVNAGLAVPDTHEHRFGEASLKRAGGLIALEALVAFFLLDRELFFTRSSVSFA